MEIKRVLDAGGFFTTETGILRTCGTLAITRALGNYHIKDERVISGRPDIFEYDLNKYK